MNYEKFTKAQEGGCSCGDMTPIVTLFFDFYALSYLSKGHGILHEGTAEKIRVEHEAIVDRLYDVMRQALQNSVDLELHYMIDGNHGRVDKSAVKVEIREILRSHGLGSLGKTIPPRVAVAIFDMRVDGVKIWHKGWGGGKWGRAADKLVEQPRNTVQKTIWIDNVFDLQHNNGFILNKTGFRVLLETKQFSSGRHTPLDFRKDLTDMKDMLPYVSGGVAKLLRYVEGRAPAFRNASAANDMLSIILSALPPEELS